MTGITLSQARRFILMKQGLYGPYIFRGKEGVYEFVRQAGCVQYDPLDICGRNHELVLHARVANVKKTHIHELLYKDRVLVDHFDKMMSIFPTEDWPYFHPVRKRFMNDRWSEEADPELIESVISHIRENGPVNSSDINIEGKTDWWWGPTKAARVALEQLYFRGDLAIHHKNGTRKFYDLADRCIPSILIDAAYPFETAEEHADWMLLRRIESIGLLWNKRSDAFLSMKGLDAKTRNMAFERLAEAGLIKGVHVEGIKEKLFFVTKDEWLMEASASTGPSSRTEFIAPLDNMMWDRNLIKDIFGFDYKWEVYTPAKDRKYGYYVLPLLHGDKLVGRIEIKRKSKRLEIVNLWLEDKVRETKKLNTGMTRRLKSLNNFLHGLK